MSEEAGKTQESQPSDGSTADSSSAGYQQQQATRVVPRQLDAFGQPYWESYMTPESFQVRAEAKVGPHLPGVIIFVHGVNSEGEWYDAAEQGICEGLNVRLNRTDATAFAPNRYKEYDKDSHRFSTRTIVEVGQSPVIRFYWGYSAESGTERNWRVALRNPKGLDYWAPECSSQGGPWYWGGGPFQNGTNNLQQLWSRQGFARHVYGVDLEDLNTEEDRKLQDAPPRDYYAHAAQRLADLIDEIRDHSHRDTVTIMSHSQGTMIALAATALCKTRAPDALFVMNSPFAMDDKFTDAVACGGERPTAEARVNTFRNIANRIKKDRRMLSEDLMQQLHVGATPDMDFWRPDTSVHDFPERDNHGRLYVYFTPHDRVMGTTPLQSIGWQGIDDKLIAELGDTVKQRMLARSTPCGDAPGVRKFGTLPPITDPVKGISPSAFWNGNRGVFWGVFGATDLWAVPSRNKTVTINAEAVPNPLTAEEMKDFEESRNTAKKWDAWDTKKQQYVDSTFPFMRSINQPEKMASVPVDTPYDGVRHQTRRENHDEMVNRINNYYPEPTNHSTLPSNVEFMKRVVAYDLPVGFCDSYDDVSFWRTLIRKADWTLGMDDYFQTGAFSPKVAKTSLIDWDTITEEKTREQIAALKASRAMKWEAR